MALSRQDQAYYEEKLGWKTLLKLMAGTAIIGVIGWPIATYILDWSSGSASKWTLSIWFDVSMFGFMFGFVVSAFMYLVFRFFLAMGWLPSRR